VHGRLKLKKNAIHTHTHTHTHTHIKNVKIKNKNFFHDIIIIKLSFQLHTLYDMCIIRVSTIISYILYMYVPNINVKQEQSMQMLNLFYYWHFLYCFIFILSMTRHSSVTCAVLSRNKYYLCLFTIPM